MAQILAVDDSAFSLELLEGVLREGGHDVVAARNGAEALEHGLAAPPDLVITDALMPVMDGFELCRRWQAEPNLRPVPLIFYTSEFADPDSRNLAMALGAAAFVAKTSQADSLLRVVDQVLAGKPAEPESPHRGADGEVTELLRHHHRLVIRRLEQSQAAMQAERDGLRAVLDALPLDVLVLDSTGRVRWANSTATDRWGRQPGRGDGEFWGQYLACVRGAGSAGECGAALGCDACPPATAIRTALASGTVDIADFGLDVATGNGSERRWFMGKATPLRFDGRPGVVLALTDITARKRIEAERQQLQASLAQSDRLASMGMLAAGVAHEINNPLTYILYNLEVLTSQLGPRIANLAPLRDLLPRLQSLAPAEVLDAALQALDRRAWPRIEVQLAEALEGTRQIRDIVRGLGTFARVEKDQRTPVHLHHPIESALSIARNELKYRARVIRDLGDVDLVLASDGRVSQVFLNLLVNAAHAIRAGDVESNTITVRTWMEDRTVCAEVADTGCGIPAENLERIFDPFFTTKPAGVGSGLGLSIVRDIVHGYGGTITVASQPDAGTRFTVRLPALDLEALPIQGRRSAGQGIRAPRGRILVVDDEATIRLTLVRMLADHEVVEADSGAAARQLLTTDQAFDAIVCDVMMPVVSGVEVHRWLAAEHPELVERFIFATGGAFTADTADYLARSGSPTVTKPFDSDQVERLVGDRITAGRAVR
jgi:signal transduction histidine kinase/CheY-like chemotaxis protein